MPSTSVKHVFLSHFSSPLFIMLIPNAGTSCLEQIDLGHHLTRHLIRTVEATWDAFLAPKVMLLGHSVVHKRTLCQPGLLDATLGLILTPLAAASLQLCIFLLVFARTDRQPQRTLHSLISLFTELYICLFPAPLLSPSGNKWWEVKSAVGIPLGSLVPIIRVMYITHL